MANAGNGYRFAYPEYERNGSKGKLVGKLYAHLDSGEGDATLDLIIEGESAMWRVDVLKDWIGLLQVEHNKAYREMMADFGVIVEEANEEHEPVG